MTTGAAAPGDIREDPRLAIPVNFGTDSSTGSIGPIAGSVLPIRRAEALILTLQGVLSVRIVSGGTGEVEEIHVLTTDEVLPKHTVRNIESALMAQLGMRVNHRKISVATTLDAQRATDVPVEAALPLAGLAGVAGGMAAGSVVSTGAVPAESAGVGNPRMDPLVSVHSGQAAVDSLGRDADGRTLERAESSISVEPRGRVATARRLLIFEDVEVRQSRTKGLTCLVTLSRDGQEYIGEAEGQEREWTRIELAARATVHAIATARGAPGGLRGFGLEGARQFDAFDREFVFVSISARVGRDLVVLTGSCEVRENAETSAVLAVLDATNRWLYLDG